MSIWKEAVLTTQGNDLLVTAAAGKQIVFTRLVTGSGVYSEQEKTRASLEKATGLKEQKQEFAFSKYEKASETSVILTALISNRELLEGYKITEIGIFGKMAEEEADFLCSIAVTNSLEETDSFPPYNGLRECQIIQDYYITISPDAEVTVNTQGAVALIEDFEHFKVQIKNELDSRIKVVIGREDMEISDNTILLIVESGAESQEFDAVAYDNIIVSEEPPASGNIENWADTGGRILTGNLTAGAQPKSGDTFFAHIEE